MASVKKEKKNKSRVGKIIKRSLLCLFLLFFLALLTGAVIIWSKYGDKLKALKAEANAIAAGSDIINTVLILIKPRNAFFYRGFYRRKN